MPDDQLHAIGVNDGAARIAAERYRQILTEGFDPQHDVDWHSSGDLLDAAVCYATEVWARSQDDPKNFPTADTGTPPVGWPWASDWWKPGDDRVRMLEKAGALIAAEIDRLLEEAGQ